MRGRHVYVRRTRRGEVGEKLWEKRHKMGREEAQARVHLREVSMCWQTAKREVAAQWEMQVRVMTHQRLHSSRSSSGMVRAPTGKQVVKPTARTTGKQLVKPACHNNCGYTAFKSVLYHDRETACQTNCAHTSHPGVRGVRGKRRRKRRRLLLV